MNKDVLPKYDMIDKIRTIHYHNADIRISVEPCRGCGVTNDFFKCGLNGCQKMVGGNSDTAHYIEEHTMEEVLRYYGLIK